MKPIKMTTTTTTSECDHWINKWMNEWILLPIKRVCCLLNGDAVKWVTHSNGWLTCRFKVAMVCLFVIFRMVSVKPIGYNMLTLQRLISIKVSLTIHKIPCCLPRSIGADGRGVTVNGHVALCCRSNRFSDGFVRELRVNECAWAALQSTQSSNSIW